MSTHDELQSSLDYYLPIGMHWERIREDRDITGVFGWLGREGLRAYVTYRADQAIELRLDGEGKIIEHRLLKGQRAKDARQTYGFRLNDELAQRLERALYRGAPLEQGLTELFGERLLALNHLDMHLRLDGSQLRRYRVPGGAILDVEVALDGTVRRRHIATGAEAAALFAGFEPSWNAVDARKGQVITVSTWGEAVLLVRMGGAEPEVARERWVRPPTQTSIMGRTDEGNRQWQLHIRDRSSLDPFDLGRDAAPAYDPADAILFHSQISKLGRETPSIRRTFLRKLAVAALRRWLQQLPPDAPGFSRDSMRTVVSRWMFDNQAQRFTRRHVQQLIEQMEGR